GSLSSCRRLPPAAGCALLLADAGGAGCFCARACRAHRAAEMATTTASFFIDASLAPASRQLHAADNIGQPPVVLLPLICTVACCRVCRCFFSTGSADLASCCTCGSEPCSISLSVCSMALTCPSVSSCVQIVSKLMPDRVFRCFIWSRCCMFGCVGSVTPSCLATGFSLASSFW